MAKALIDLNDRIVTDSGDVIARYDRLYTLAKNGVPLAGVRVLREAADSWKQKDMAFYNRRNPEGKLVFWDEGDIEGPPAGTYEWRIPDTHKYLDLIQTVSTIYAERFANLPNAEAYKARMINELAEIESREMSDFIRCLIYIVDVFRRKGVVWGVGRGSSCASLVLYMLGVNAVDPVRFNIPMEEFFK